MQILYGVFHIFLLFQVCMYVLMEIFQLSQDTNVNVSFFSRDIFKIIFTKISQNTFYLLF